MVTCELSDYNLDLPRAMAARYARSGLDQEAVEDIEGYLTVALVQALNCYDGGRAGGSLSGYLHARLRLAMKRFWVQGRRPGVPTSGVVHENVPAPPAGPDLAELREECERALAAMRPREADAVRMRFLEGATNAEAGRRLGVTPQAITWLVDQGMLRARRAGRSP